MRMPIGFLLIFLIVTDYTMSFKRNVHRNKVRGRGCGGRTGWRLDPGAARVQLKYFKTLGRVCTRWIRAEVLEKTLSAVLIPAPLQQRLSSFMTTSSLASTLSFPSGELSITATPVQFQSLM